MYRAQQPWHEQGLIRVKTVSNSYIKSDPLILVSGSNSLAIPRQQLPNAGWYAEQKQPSQNRQQ